MRSATTSGPGSPGGSATIINVSDLLTAAANTFATRPALIWSTGSSSWADLNRAVDAGAAELAAAGLAPGSRVIVSLETGPNIIAALFAVARAGLIAVPIGPNRPDLKGVVAKVGATAAIAAQSGTGVDFCWSPEQVSSWWSAPDVSQFAAVGGSEDIAVLARAASSDRPVMVSHRAIIAAVRAIAATPRLALRAEDRAVMVLPAYHLAGWVTAFLPLSLVGGAAVVPDVPTAQRSWLEAVLAAVREHKVSVIPGAPSLYRRLRSVPGVERALASVRVMTSGAAPLDPDDFSAMRAITGQRVWEGYGISESASVVSTSLMGQSSRTGSVGLPLTGIGIRIVGEDGLDLYVDHDDSAAHLEHSEDLGADSGAAGEVGRIQISGPTLFSGYWPDGLDGPDEAGWFSTGDLGYLDDAEELHLVDSAAETIRVAGFTVYPREIEAVLMMHPYIRDAAVIGVPGRAGQAMAAMLVPLWGTHPTDDDLDEFVAARLPLFKRPQSYHLSERLPRNEIGRIDRDAVRALYRISTRFGDSAASSVEDATPAASQHGRSIRLPGTGEPDLRSDQDTDEDLF